MDKNSMKRLKNGKRTGSFVVRASATTMIQRKMVNIQTHPSTPYTRANHARGDYQRFSTPLPSSSSSNQISNPWPFVCYFTGAGLLPSIPPPPSPWSSFVFSTPSPPVSRYSFGDTRLSTTGVEQWLQNGGMFPTPTPSPLFFISSARRDVVDSDDDDNDDESDNGLNLDDNNDDEDNDDHGNNNNSNRGSGSGVHDSGNDSATSEGYPRAPLEQMARRRIIRAYRPGAATAVTMPLADVATVAISPRQSATTSAAAATTTTAAATAAATTAAAAAARLPSPSSLMRHYSRASVLPEYMESRRILRANPPDVYATITTATADTPTTAASSRVLDYGTVVSTSWRYRERLARAALVRATTTTATITTAAARSPASSSSSLSSSNHIAVNHSPSSPGVAITVTVTTTSATTPATSVTTSSSNSTASYRNLPPTPSLSPTAASSTTTNAGSTQSVTVEQEMYALREKVRALEQAEQRQCVICLENPKNVVLSPCNHLCICEDCSAHVVRTCPICRSTIKKKTVVYL